MELIQANAAAARLRLQNAQTELKVVLGLLTDLPPGLKTGVIRAIETAFDDLRQAETHVVDMDEIVRGQKQPRADSPCAPELP